MRSDYAACGACRPETRRRSSALLRSRCGRRDRAGAAQRGDRPHSRRRARCSRSGGCPRRCATGGEGGGQRGRTGAPPTQRRPHQRRRWRRERRNVAVNLTATRADERVVRARELAEDADGPRASPLSTRDPAPPRLAECASAAPPRPSRTASSRVEPLGRIERRRPLRGPAPKAPLNTSLRVSRTRRSLSSVSSGVRPGCRYRSIATFLTSAGSLDAPVASSSR